VCGRAVMRSAFSETAVDCFSHFFEDNIICFDGLDRSVQMRLYTLNKRHFALVFMGFLIGFAVTIIIGLAGKYFMLFDFVCFVHVIM